MCGSVFCFYRKFFLHRWLCIPAGQSPLPWDPALTPCSLPASYSFSSTSSDFLFLNTQPLGFLYSLLPGFYLLPGSSSSNLFPSLIQIQIRQLLIMQIVFALFLGYLPSVTLNLSSSPFSPCLAHLLFPICWHWVRQWPSVTRTNKLSSYLRLISVLRLTQLWVIWDLSLPGDSEGQGKPGVLQSMGSQRVGDDLATEQQQHFANVL